VYEASRIATERIGDPTLNGDRWTKAFASVIEQMAKPLLNGSNGNGSAAHNSVQNVKLNGRLVHDAENATAAILAAMSRGDEIREQNISPG
jgi:hypothetical protein